MAIKHAQLAFLLGLSVFLYANEKPCFSKKTLVYALQSLEGSSFWLSIDAIQKPNYHIWVLNLKQEGWIQTPSLKAALPVLSPCTISDYLRVCTLQQGCVEIPMESVVFSPSGALVPATKLQVGSEVVTNNGEPLVIDCIEGFSLPEEEGFQIVAPSQSIFLINHLLIGNG